MTMNSMRVLTPRELADVIGVSESSLKRWADDGALRVTRTAGGHRRIPLPEAIRFVRETRSPLMRPGILGLPDVDAVSGDLPAESDAAQRLQHYLMEGLGREARGLVMAAYLGGREVPAILDDLISPAMRNIGELWLHSDCGVFVEHRATDICIQAVNQLRATLPVNPHGPAAVGGAPSRDPYIIGSIMAATVLAAEGFHAVNLGPNTPGQALLQAGTVHKAMLMWLSISATEQIEGIDSDVRAIVEGLKNTPTRLVIGGRSRSLVSSTDADRMVVFASMSDLSIYARGLIGQN